MYTLRVRTSLISTATKAAALPTSEPDALRAVTSPKALVLAAGLGVVGAIAGSAGSGVQREQNVLGLLGAVAGAAAGNAVERMSTKEEALEIIVQLKNGDRRAIVQAKGGETLLAGDKVILVTTGGKVRVSRAPN